MASTKPRSLLRIEYANTAEAYLRSLPPEHFMEATPQATQREITLASFALVKGQRSDFYYFNELLIQYPFGPQQEIHQVVPDNMVVLSKEPIQAVGSYDVPFQPVQPFWALEYVSRSSQRKDYEESFRKYERELKLPYLLMFYPEAQELRLYHHAGRKYRSVPVNEAGRHPIPDLELEIALVEGWARFWYQGQLLELPAALQRQMTELQRENQLLKKENRKVKDQARRAHEQAQEQVRQAHEQAQEQVRQAHEQAEQQRLRAERLAAKLRELGIEP